MNPIMKQFILTVLFVWIGIMPSWSNVSPRIHGVSIRIDKVEDGKVFVTIVNNGDNTAILNDPKLGGLNFEIRVRSTMTCYNTSFRGSIGSNMPKLLKIAPQKMAQLELNLRNWHFPEGVPESLSQCDLRIWYSAHGFKTSDTVWLGPFVSEWFASPSVHILEEWKKIKP